MDITGMIRRHPRTTAIVTVLGIGLFIFVMLWFTPWRLFTDDPVDEALPGAAPRATTAEDPADMMMESAGSSSTIVEGAFIGLEHESEGRAVVIETADGKRFLRFEEFETSNGPDLVVYLSTKDADPNDWHGYDGDFVDLGPLKGNVGDQNYRLPDDVDLDRYSTAVIWCRRFAVGFAAADLA